MAANTLQVDMDLGKEGNASQVSRQQARCALRLDGAFAITNCGRRKLHVNGCQVGHTQPSFYLGSASCWKKTGLRMPADRGRTLASVV